MSETSDIDSDDDVIDVIAIEPDEDEFDIDMPETSRTRPLWPFALAGGVLVGFAVAFGAGWYVFKQAPYDPSPLQAEIDTLRQSVAALEAKPDPEIPGVNLAPLRNRIATLEARPIAEPINEDLIARMEALQADGFELPEMPEIPDVSSLEARLSELDAKVTALEARPVTPQSVIVADVLTIDPATLPALPVQALRDVVAENSDRGFFQRTLSRHIRVKGDDQPDRLIDLIVKDLEAGRPQAALEKFDRLPPAVQALAQGWRADMEAVLQ